MYRPNEGDVEGHENIMASINKLQSYPHITVWIAGDFNYPGINWASKEVTTTSRHKKLSQEFVDTLNDNGLEQLVKEPVQGANPPK